MFVYSQVRSTETWISFASFDIRFSTLLPQDSVNFLVATMGGIDEVVLDCLSLVTAMTRHIRVRASGGKASASKLGQFSLIFIWLPRDFYLDWVEDNRKITPRDYLQLALKPVQGGEKDVAAKNEESVFSQYQFHMLHYLFAHTQNFTRFTPNNDGA
uniref:Guanylate-binding protein N-terminal domain-containing protein n=1 Tax=Solanum lycopersicum TaxID=4081 RepID=A0A494G8N4_SOLLC